MNVQSQKNQGGMLAKLLYLTFEESRVTKLVPISCSEEFLLPSGPIRIYNLHVFDI